MRVRTLTSLLLVVAMLLTACGGVETTPDAGDTAAPDGATAAPTAEETETMASSDEFFDQAEYERQLAQMDIEPEGPADQPWLQMIEPEMVDTGEFQTEPPWHVCFSNASVNNPWRQTGWTTMQAEVELHDDIGEFTAVDAEASDEQQISDIESLLNQDCDALIISPNTTAALTPAVEQACESGLPVVVFDRGVNTDCMTSFVKPIGGYAFGASAANFLVDELDPGDNVLALRVLPGVDVLERRWAAAERIFADAEVEVAGVEFTENDPATAKSVVTDYIQREGGIDGIWMDDGTAATAALEAFEDLGQPLPAISGEDQHQFLAKWQNEDLTGHAPTYPTFQWRTAIIASTQILSGEEVPSNWTLPQPVITQDNLDEWFTEDMPPLFYALCGCQEMPQFPDMWQN